MKILVTGGAGFIGSHVVDALVKRKHEVIVLDDLSSGKKAFVNPVAKLIRAQVEDDKIVGLVKRLAPQAIYHFAAQKDARLSVIDPVLDARTNIIGLLQLIKGAMQINLKRFVLASTGGAIYGGADEIPTPEEYPAHPLSPYGVSKLASEHYLHSYRHAGGFPFVSLRFANVYGPRQNPKSEAGVIAIFIRSMLEGRPPIINGDGKQTRDYVYVDDVARACLSALTAQPGIYNIGTARETDLNQMVEMLNALLGTSFAPVYGPAKMGEETRSAIAYTRAKNAFGWEPKVAIEQGLAKTIAWQKQMMREGKTKLIS